MPRNCDPEKNTEHVLMFWIVVAKAIETLMSFARFRRRVNGLAWWSWSYSYTDEDRRRIRRVVGPSLGGRLPRASNENTREEFLEDLRLFGEAYYDQHASFDPTRTIDLTRKENAA